ncbi:MAG TPA: hypothetical protein VFO14_11085 [Vicinamibacterales bacterium]|nr:hypothetical protein [Vicinamibacterales bacterium]
MTFANPLPWWALGLVLVAAAAVAWQAYRSFSAAPAARYVLASLRFVTLILLVVCLMRPVARSTAADGGRALVPVLVDVSRSMGIEDADGERRIDSARRLIAGRLLPVLGPRFQVELLSFGEVLQPVNVQDLSATARESNLSGALSAVAERFRGRPIAGIVLLSDGGDTAALALRDLKPSPAVFPIGIGSPQATNDREVLGVTAADAVLDDSRVDLAVSAVSHGRGVEPFDLRLSENGRPIEVRRVVPVAEGSPVNETFRVSPVAGVATVYTVEIPSASDELVPENNTRSALVQPPARARRILLVEGAPGYEHSFLKRAWAADKGLEIDSVVRKGRNEQGQDTFYIQAAQSRSAGLRAGYPLRAEDLFRYDALVLANVSGDQLTRAQLDATRAFVAHRGGGLLVLGAHSFLRHGLLDTPIEDVLPLDLTDRGGSVLPASSRGSGPNRLRLTPEGEMHPMMQIAAGAEETRKRWDGVPALAAIAPLGGPRPGATVLAMTSGPGGAPRALVAVQRFGEGRSMVFSGEAAWRWRMMQPAGNRSYETFWRQAVRWLALAAPEPIVVSTPPAAVPGENLPIRIVVRNAAFAPERDASVDVRITSPSGRYEQLRAIVDGAAPGSGQYVAHFAPAQPGVYRVTAEARRDTAMLGTAGVSLLVGGGDPEMSDPRRNDSVLQRLASASGGRVTTAEAIEALADTLEAAVPSATLAVRRDLWHNAWSLLALVSLLSGEWVLRRRWGLR